MKANGGDKKQKEAWMKDFLVKEPGQRDLFINFLISICLSFSRSFDTSYIEHIKNKMLAKIIMYSHLHKFERKLN